MTGDDIRDIFLVQSSVAGEVAARAARQITPMQIARLEEIHDAVIETVARAAVETLEELNHQFHRAINLAVHSPKLVLVIQILARDTPRCFYATKDCDCSRNCPDTTVEDHGVLLDAMRCACDAVAPRSGGAIAHQIMFDARPSYRRASRRD
ncbi:FCD domain-containing protein [Rhodococcus oxybenzonivorans]|uniref:FCD domain-containing protein n=1 Tax=Rhodococcus oxybenzonivorans TaxID=1990687 RepID=UPI002952F9B8|nr:FCD domain-containing protein [Rhodococcus oxybenzonivorans]MDV7352709.1 FCD domain-containing protein [Rhodococcus oxybenzonivorans]